jgi:hypothetical protein
MQLSIQENPAFAADFNLLMDPTVLPVNLPQRCYPGVWEKDINRGKGRCLSFVIAPNGTDALGVFARSVATQMAQDASFGGQGQDYGYEFFADEDHIDDWLFHNVNATPVAIIFHGDGSITNKVSYTVQYNHTANCNVLNVLDCTNPRFDLMASFQMLIDQSVLKLKSGVTTSSIQVRSILGRNRLFKLSS